MFEKEAKEWVTANTGFNPREPLGILAVRTYLAGLEAGIAKRPSLDVVNRIAHAFDMKLSDLCKLIEEMD